MLSMHNWFSGLLVIPVFIASGYVTSNHGIGVANVGTHEVGTHLSAMRSRVEFAHRVATPDSLTVLIQGLRTIGGSYFKDPHLFIWAFSLQHDRRITRITQYGQAAVAPLASCISDTHPTGTYVNGQRVLMGALCGWVLESIIYHEASDSAGDIDPFWPGHIVPTANAHALRAAARALKAVLREGAYSFL
jgi:hypothetical protein